MFPVVQIVHRPGILDLGWGHPDPAVLPVAALQRATAAVLARYGADALAYGAERGPGPLIAWICARLAHTDARTPEPTDVVITAGASHALDLLCTICTTPRRYGARRVADVPSGGAHPARSSAELSRRSFRCWRH